VFREEGTELPRVAADQAQVGLPIVMGALEAGDRVYFKAGHEIDHTGIYMGDGRFIHASGSGGAVRIDDLFDARWQRIYAGARR
jgi:cell wall-associated NlpC family hydrolase